MAFEEKWQLLTHMDNMQFQDWKHQDHNLCNLKMTCRTVVGDYQNRITCQNVSKLLASLATKSKRLEQPTLSGCRSTSYGTVSIRQHTGALDHSNSRICQPLGGWLQYWKPLQHCPGARETGERTKHGKNPSVGGSLAQPSARNDGRPACPEVTVMKEYTNPEPPDKVSTKGTA